MEPASTEQPLAMAVQFMLHADDTGMPAFVSYECLECGQGGASTSLSRLREQADDHMAIVHHRFARASCQSNPNPYFRREDFGTPPAPRPGAGGTTPL